MTPPSLRETDVRLARLHLRGGILALARAELETLAGADRLDDDGILDLAEVRWRTGDLAGAAAAASAWLEDERRVAGGPGGGRGPGPRRPEEGNADAEHEGRSDAALAHVIAGEAAAAAGRAGEAARHVDAAARDISDRRALDDLLAGMPARAPWPWPQEAAVAPGAEPAAATAWFPPGATAAIGTSASEPGPTAAATIPAAAVPAAGPPPTRVPDPRPPISRPADELVKAGTALLEEAPTRAAVLFGLALRADRAAADAVLTALDDATSSAATGSGAPGADAEVAASALAFARAEALRAAGRHSEARIAYASAERLAISPADAGPPGSSQ